jgi:steroid 5-alpha reductase family enzyme
MALATLLPLAALLLALIMTGAWALALRLNNAGWVDTVWTAGLGITASLASLLAGSGIHARLAALAALIWAIRLAWHLATRTAGHPEDTRYAALRAEWGAAYKPKLLIFLYIQAAAAFLLLLSPVFAARNLSPFGIADAAGVLIFAAAILGEAIADRQLQAFRDKPENRGQICDSGLWSLSRHPNYFFEWLGWCAYPILALGGGAAGAVIALTGPVLMYVLLVHVSGLPPLEAQMLASRGERFRAYQARTRAFFPIPRLT